MNLQAITKVTKTSVVELEALGLIFVIMCCK